jgi:hypothetical protein
LIAFFSDLWLVEAEPGLMRSPSLIVPVAVASVWRFFDRHGTSYSVSCTILLCPEQDVGDLPKFGEKTPQKKTPFFLEELSFLLTSFIAARL